MGLIWTLNLVFLLDHDCPRKDSASSKSLPDVTQVVTNLTLLFESELGPRTGVLIPLTLTGRNRFSPSLFA